MVYYYAPGPTMRLTVDQMLVGLLDEDSNIFALSNT